LTPDPVTVPSFSLDGRVAVVTGASSGIGARAARVLHAAGARVALLGRRSERVEGLAAELDDALALPCDIRVEGSVTAALAGALETLGRFDVLVNAAGIVASSPAQDEEVSTFEDIVQTNLIGLFRVTQIVARPMLEQRSGSIVHIGSINGLVAGSDGPVAGYAASKGGVANLTRELAVQWGPSGIRVNSIAPGPYPSEMNNDYLDPEHEARVSSPTALGRVARVDELDGALLFLASDASSYVTGHTLVVDGGHTAS
jgi:NAD(P)-dependent dehydrogenase (short-subunit alcohol dehydrogenase family)